MRPAMTPVRRASLTVAVVCGVVAVVAPAPAATVYKANNNDPLDVTSSWWTTTTGVTNPTVIGTADTLWFGNGMAATRTLAVGSPLAVGAVRVDNHTGTPNYGVTISAGNPLTLNGNNDYNAGYVSGIVLNSGAGGPLTIEADVVVGASQRWVASRNLTVSGNVSLGANTLTLWQAGGTGTFSGVFGGTGGLLKDISAGGASVLTGANVYTGSTQVAFGILRVTGGGVLGGQAGSTADAGNILFNSANSGMAVEFETAANLGPASQIRFRNSGGTAGQGGVMRYIGTTDQTVSKTLQCDTSIGMRLESNSVGGSVTFNGPFSQASRPLSLGGTGTGNNTLASVFSGTGLLTKRDAGTWVLNQANTYTGVTTIAGGVLKVTTLANGGTSSSIGQSSNAVGNLVFNGGALEYTGSGASTDRGFTISSSARIDASGTGALTWSGASPAFTTANTSYTLTLGGSSAQANSFGTVLANNGTGAVNLIKAGTGLWALGGQNTYTGSTTVSGGTLLVNGSLGGTSGVSVAAGAVLGGTGSINATIAGAGLVSPGTSPGITTAAAVNPAAGTQFAFEFTAPGSPAYGSAAASINDVLRLTGAAPFAANLSGGNVVNLYFDVATLAVGDTFQGGFFTDTQTDFLASIDSATFAFWVKGNGAGTARTFNGQGYYALSGYDAALSITRSTGAASAAFAGGTVTGQATQFVVVPEPGTLALTAVGLGVVASSLLRRRR